jgi:hypothetical protein
MDDAEREERRKREQIATVIAGVATEVDAVAMRAAKAIAKLETLDARPNDIVAVRRAVEGLDEVGKALRRDSLLAPDQQRLL